MPELLSDKVDDIFSFAGILEVVPSVEHFRLAFFRYDSKTSPAGKFLIYALFLSERICKGKECFGRKVLESTFKNGSNGDVYSAALGGTWRVATIMGAKALHTLSECYPATENVFLLLLERLGQFNFSSGKAVAEEGCNSFTLS